MKLIKNSNTKFDSELTCIFIVFNFKVRVDHETQ